MSSITRFQGNNRFLSNFYIEPDGSSVEVEYQREKCKYNCDRDLFNKLTPGQAKRLGRNISIRDDWEVVKKDVMRRFVSKKFGDHASLREKLLNTGDALLVEGNNWGDTFWGVCRNIGRNELGKILMETRSLLRSCK